MSMGAQGNPNETIVVLSGGVGGAKLCLGLQNILPPGALRVIVNTGDDFEHLGLAISPDLDTTIYTLGGLANPELGWGRRDETWTFLSALKTLGGPTWFRLGDGDLALHVERTRRLTAGETLSSIMDDLARRLGVVSRIVPMSDDRVQTRVSTPDGELAFQDYFVRGRCASVVTGLHFCGAERARIAAAAAQALREESLRGIFIAPSNPYLSIDPALAIPGMRAALRDPGVPIIVVSPIVAGEAVKGPTAKIMKELGLVPSPLTVRDHYDGLVDGMVLDERDAELAPKVGVPVRICDTLMSSLEDRKRVARCALELARDLA